jgi:hypothetical protein
MLLLALLYSLPSDCSIVGWPEHDLPLLYRLGMDEPVWDDHLYVRHPDRVTRPGIGPFFARGFSAHPLFSRSARPCGRSGWLPGRQPFYAAA